MQTDDEKAMLQVSVSDIKQFLQWKEASVDKKVWLTQTRGGKSTKIFYSSKSTITLLKFYLSTSKSTSLKIYSSKSKK